MAPSPSDQSPIPNSCSSSPVTEDNTAERGERKKQISWGNDDDRTWESLLRQHFCGCPSCCSQTLCYSAELDGSLFKLSADWKFLPVEGLFSSGLALASLWWNRAVWVLKICVPVVVERWLLGVALRKGRAEQRRSKAHLKVVGHLDRTSIRDRREKVWPCDYKHLLTERKTQISDLTSPPLDLSDFGRKIPIKIIPRKKYISVLLLKH